MVRQDTCASDQELLVARPTARVGPQVALEPPEQLVLILGDSEFAEELGYRPWRVLILCLKPQTVMMSTGWTHVHAGGQRAVLTQALLLTLSA